MTKIPRSSTGAALTAASALTAACVVHASVAPSSVPVPPSSLDLLEIDGKPVLLATTRLVTCNRNSLGEAVFFWTGSNILTPRRPFDDRDSDSVEVRLHTDPVTVSEFELAVNGRGGQTTLRWPGATEPRFQGSATSTSRGPHDYALDAVVAESARSSTAHIEFRC